MELVKLGISFATFSVLFGLFEKIWDHYTKHTAFKWKRLIYTGSILILFVVSIFIGSANYDLVNHGKDKDEPLKGYITEAVNTQMLPAYILKDSRPYRAFVQMPHMKPDYEIVLSNSNDLDVIINDIEIVIDNYEKEKKDIYQTQYGAMGDGEYCVFYGNVHKNEKKVKLLYWGQGYSDYFDFTSNEHRAKTYAKMASNSHDIVVPYSPFDEPGLYTIHYVVNYSLNGQQKQLELPQETFYMAEDDNPVYYLSACDWNEYFGWYFEDFEKVVDKGLTISNEKMDRLQCIESWYPDYTPNKNDPFYGDL